MPTKTVTAPPNPACSTTGIAPGGWHRHYVKRRVSHDGELHTHLFFEQMISTRQMALSDWIRMAADRGLDGIEVYRPYLKSDAPTYMDGLADEIHKAGLEVSMFTGCGEPTTPCAKERLAQLV